MFTNDQTQFRRVVGILAKYRRRHKAKAQHAITAEFEPFNLPKQAAIRLPLIKRRVECRPCPRYRAQWGLLPGDRVNGGTQGPMIFASEYRNAN